MWVFGDFNSAFDINVDHSKEQDEDSGHPKAPALTDIRSAIPTHCFHRSHLISFSYLFRDVVYVSALVLGALQIPSMQSAILRTLGWVVYGLLQGFVFTGIWILGHECGHGAFSSNAVINDVVGWTLHSALLVPYFSWKITHARHHRYTGHMEKDTAFVPLTQAEYAKKGGLEVTDLADLMQDTPLKTLVTLIGHQLAGWQIYLFTYATGGEQSGAQGTADNKRIPSHFDPYSPLFTRQQRSAVVLSNIGISIMFIILFYMGRKLGVLNIGGLYFMPYLWTHHWLVAITYLHHTHTEIPHYSASTWSFQKGALGTVDRSFGFIGRHFFHDIIDHHVVHHLFPRIPFYKAEEATAAIKPALGTAYHEKKQENFLFSLWTTFRECQYVSDTNPDEGSGVLLFNRDRQNF